MLVLSLMQSCHAGLPQSSRVDQPALGGALHPCPDERHELADEEQPEIAMFQRGEGVSP